MKKRRVKHVKMRDRMHKTTNRPSFHKGDYVRVRKDTGPHTMEWKNTYNVLEEHEHCESYYIKDLDTN